MDVQENELLQPEEREQEPNVELLTQLLSMGFDLDKCKHALISTGNSGKHIVFQGMSYSMKLSQYLNTDLNTAMEYILSNTCEGTMPNARSFSGYTLTSSAALQTRAFQKNRYSRCAAWVLMRNRRRWP